MQMIQALKYCCLQASYCSGTAIAANKLNQQLLSLPKSRHSKVFKWIFCVFLPNAGEDYILGTLPPMEVEELQALLEDEQQVTPLGVASTTGSHE